MEFVKKNQQFWCQGDCHVHPQLCKLLLSNVYIRDVWYQKRVEIYNRGEIPKTAENRGYLTNTMIRYIQQN
jgi:hypothetical protein